MDSKNPGSNSPNGSNADAEGYSLVQSRKKRRSQRKTEESPRTSPKASSDDMFGDSPNAGTKSPALFSTIPDIHCQEDFPVLPPSPGQLQVAGPSGICTPSQKDPSTSQMTSDSDRHVISPFFCSIITNIML